MDLSAGFVQTNVQVPETDGLTSARLRAFVNGRIIQPVILQISIRSGTATGKILFHRIHSLCTLSSVLSCKANRLDEYHVHASSHHMFTMSIVSNGLVVSAPHSWGRLPHC